MKSYGKKYRSEHKEQKNLYMKKYWSEHRKERKLYNKQYMEKHKEELRKKKHENYIKNIEYHRQKHKEWSKNHLYYTRDQKRKKRATILERLGNQCVKCYANDKRVLCIDHVNGGGTKERRALGTDRLIMKLSKLSDDELRLNYQVLCANCNMIKYFEDKSNNREKRNEVSKEGLNVNETETDSLPGCIGDLGNPCCSNGPCRKCWVRDTCRDMSRKVVKP